MSDIIFQLKNLKKDFNTDDGRILKAVNDVSLIINKGERVAIVGESGCGKSTLAKLITHIEEPTSGQILFMDRDITSIKGKELRDYRKKIQMVFQQPSEAFSSRMKVGQFLMEPWLNFEKKSRREAREEALKSLDRVKLPREYFDKYPHMLSGGELQRVCVARAIALQPEVLICDEATSALDVSIQREIVQLLEDEQRKSDFTILFISHDLAITEEFCTRVIIMYLGEIVEILDSGCLLKDARHPYTKSLLQSVFRVFDSQDRPIHVLDGDPPSPIGDRQGCSFCSRCDLAVDICKTMRPNLATYEGDHVVACHLVNIQQKKEAVK